MADQVEGFDSEGGEPVAPEPYAVRPELRLDVEAKLHELERQVAEAKTVPLSASIMLSKSTIDSLLSDIRAGLPEEMRQARWIVKEREQLVEEARADADKIVAEAKSERRRLIAKTDIVKAANKEADRIVDDAEEHARQIRLEAEDYVDAKLANFEVVLNKTLQAVAKGREKLRGRLDMEDLAAELGEDD